MERRISGAVAEDIESVFYKFKNRLVVVDGDGDNVKSRIALPTVVLNISVCKVYKYFSLFQVHSLFGISE